MFFGLPLFAIGYLLNSNKLKNISLSKTFLFAIIFFVLQIFESKIIMLECYISSILAAIFFLLFFVNTNNIVTKNEIFYKLFGKNFSFYIYVVHVIVANALYKYFLWSKVAFHFCIFFVSILIILLLRSFNLFIGKSRNVN